MYGLPIMVFSVGGKVGKRQLWSRRPRRRSALSPVGRGSSRAAL